MTPRRSTLLLVLSLAANAALAAALWRRAVASDPAAAASTVGTRESISPSATRRGPSAHASAESVSPAAGASTAGHTWAELDSSDLETFIHRLRAAGFPRKVIIALVEKKVARHFAEREEALHPGFGAAPFWREAPNPFDRPESREAITRLNREQQDTLAKLLGVGYKMAEESELLRYRRMWGDLSEEKLSRILEINQDSFRARSEIYQPGRGQPSDADREKLLALDQEQRVAIEKLLTPEELTQYDLHRSPVNNSLTSSLSSFDPTEAEFMALHRILAPFAEEYRWRYREPTASEQAARKLAEEQLQPVIKAALGEERYADYVQAKNPAYESLNGLVGRLGLTLSTARDVAAVQEATTQRADAIRASSTLTPDQRSAQLLALANDAQARITTSLGAKGFEAYKNYGGQWLTGLRAPTPRR